VYFKAAHPGGNRAMGSVRSVARGDVAAALGKVIVAVERYYLSKDCLPRRPALTTPPKLPDSYKTAKFKLGDVVNRARRGDVRIVGQTDVPIP
jgi:hypothetical protein